MFMHNLVLNKIIFIIKNIEDRCTIVHCRQGTTFQEY